MPLEGLRTVTNMGGELKENESWNEYTHECKQRENKAVPLHPITPSGRGQHFNNPEPKTVEKDLSTGKTTRKRSNKPSVRPDGRTKKTVTDEADKKLQEVNQKDIKKRNLAPKKVNDKTD